MVQHLWLRIELDEYPEDRWFCEETPGEKARNSQIIVQAYRDLFKLLAAENWSNRLKLEISIHSPSDLVRPHGIRIEDEYLLETDEDVLEMGPCPSEEAALSETY